jgi:hypothetical protein
MSELQTSLHKIFNHYMGPNSDYGRREIVKREAGVAALLALKDPVLIKHAIMTSRAGRILRQEFSDLDLDTLVQHCVEASGGSMHKRSNPRPGGTINKKDTAMNSETIRKIVEDTRGMTALCKGLVEHNGAATAAVSSTGCWRLTRATSIRM